LCSRVVDARVWVWQISDVTLFLVVVVHVTSSVATRRNGYTHSTGALQDPGCLEDSMPTMWIHIVIHAYIHTLQTCRQQLKHFWLPCTRHDTQHTPTGLRCVFCVTDIHAPPAYPTLASALLLSAPDCTSRRALAIVDRKVLVRRCQHHAHVQWKRAWPHRPERAAFLTAALLSRPAMRRAERRPHVSMWNACSHELKDTACIA
jgi:hypothetical protein